MGRVSIETIQNVSKFFDSLPDEAKNKCALCNETLVHIVKTAEVKTGAGTATITRILSERINDKAAPSDVVSSEQLRGRVRDKEGSLKRYIVPNSKPESSDSGCVNTQDSTHIPGLSYSLDDPRIQPHIKTTEIRDEEVRRMKIYRYHLLSPVEEILKCPVGPAEVYQLIPDYSLRNLEKLGKAIEFLSAIKRIHEAEYEKTE